MLARYFPRREPRSRPCLRMVVPQMTTTARLTVRSERGQAFIEPTPEVRALIPTRAEARAVKRQGLVVGGTPWFEITPPPQGRWPVPADSPLIGNALGVGLKPSSPARLVYAALLNAVRTAIGRRQVD